jgi:hypothetical protein
MANTHCDKAITYFMDGKYSRWQGDYLLQEWQILTMARQLPILWMANTHDGKAITYFMDGKYLL